MKKTIKNAISPLTAKLAALFLLAFGCAGAAFAAVLFVLYLIISRKAKHS